MKILAKALSLLIVITVSFVACEKNDNLTDNPTFNPLATGDDPKLPNGNGGGNLPSLTPPYLVADIDGTTINFDTTIWDTEIDSAMSANNEGVYAYTSDLQELYFGIERPVVSDTTYQIDLTSAIGLYRSDTANTDSSNTFLILAGSITVDLLDSANNVYRGSFNNLKGYNILGTDSVAITNGMFEVSK